MAASSDTVRLLQLLSKQLDPKDTVNQVYSDNEEEEDGNDPSLVEDEEAFNVQAQSTSSHERRYDTEMAMGLERLRLEAAHEHSALKGRIVQLEEENRKLHAALRRSKERFHELDESYAVQVDEVRVMAEHAQEELQASFDEERTKLLRDRYELELAYKDEVGALETSYQAWAEEVQEQNASRLRLAEDERYDAVRQMKELEGRLLASEMEKEQMTERFEKQLLEAEVTIRDLKLSYEDQMRRDKEARTAQSRIRVSKALDSLPL